MLIPGNESSFINKGAVPVLDANHQNGPMLTEEQLMTGEDEEPEKLNFKQKFMLKKKKKELEEEKLILQKRETELQLMMKNKLTITPDSENKVTQEQFEN